MSYVKSLRFKLMLLCVIPLFAAAFMFIGYSVVIAYDLKDLAAETYISAATSAGAEQAVISAVRLLI